jgi:hypothetical protein
VCMPIKKCKLLQADQCARNETCGVVTDMGDTGCVETGPAGAGSSCEGDHCAANLTCLGSPGNRRCYALCRVGGTTCPQGETCATSTLFEDPSFGVCRP